MSIGGTHRCRSEIETHGADNASILRNEALWSETVLSENSKLLAS
jgi:hypothetical protein